MPRTLLISDLHLAPDRPRVSNALQDFLTANRDCDALYILGDLFEVWVGDDDDDALATDIASALRDFSNGGSALFLMHGNRDFLLGPAFCADVGATLLDDPTTVLLHGTPTLLMHGDSLCTGDIEYQRFRQQARDPAWQAQLLDRSLEERRAFAMQLRTISKESNSNKAEDIMDVTPEEVERELAEHGVTRLIHGHTHRPGVHRQANGERWVLGDWDRKGWYIALEGDNIELVDFDINQ